jgi:1-acyl-sn-glycerol-3-phosphate acyltransferase
VESLKALRLFFLAWHVAAGLLAAAFFPLLPSAGRAALQRLWSRGALFILGVRLAVDGEAPRTGSLIVANHVSWLDVLAITAVCPASFVCKQEIASWPLLGWLLKRAGTVFMRRASAWSAWRAVLAIAPMLRSRSSIAVFPEGTTTLGDAVLPFYPALFQSAVNARSLVQPVAIVYARPDGGRRYEAVYVGETSFGRSLLDIAGASDLNVTLSLLPAFSATELTRRQAAERSRALIASRIGHMNVAVASQREPILRAA